MISLSNPTNRNTEARVLTLGPHRLYFSYETLVAYAGPLGAATTSKKWSVTTSKHIREMGADRLPRIDQEELERRVQPILDAVEYLSAPAEEGER